MTNRADVVRVGTGIMGGVIGLPIGGLIGYYSVVLLGPAVYGREFHQIGWLYIMFTIPVGAAVGAVLGVVTGILSPRLFAVTFIPVAVFFVVLEVAQYHLRRVEEPRSYVVDVTTHEIGGTVRGIGRKFAGTITADGVEHNVQGTIPAKFTYEALRIDWVITMVDAQKDEFFSIDVFVDGKHQSGVDSDWRITGYVESVGMGPWARTGSSAKAEQKTP